MDRDPTVYVARRDHGRDTVVHVVCPEDTFDDLSGILQEVTKGRGV